MFNGRALASDLSRAIARDARLLKALAVAFLFAAQLLLGFHLADHADHAAHDGCAVCQVASAAPVPASPISIERDPASLYVGETTPPGPRIAALAFGFQPRAPPASA